MPEDKDEFGGVALADPQTDEFGGTLVQEEPQAPAAPGPKLVPPGLQFNLTPYQKAAMTGADTGMWGEGPMAIARGQAGGGGEALAATVAPAVKEAIESPLAAAGKVLNVPFRLGAEALNAIIEQERRAGGQGIAIPPERFGQTKEEREEELKYPIGKPGVPLYQPSFDPTQGPTDVQKLLSGISTPEGILSLPLGATRTGARLLLAQMVPDVAQKILQVAKGEGAEGDKMDRIRELALPAILGLLGTRPRGVELFPQRVETLPVDYTATTPITLTGGEALLNRPQGAVPPPPEPPGPAPTYPVPPRPGEPPRPAPPYPPPMAEPAGAPEVVPPDVALRRENEARRAAGLPPKPVPAKPTVESAPTKPEISKLGTNPNKQWLGDPTGTRYHASPRDWIEWQKILAEKEAIKKNPNLTIEQKFKGSAELNQRYQDIRNKYGGMDPDPPKAVTARDLANLTPEQFKAWKSSQNWQEETPGQIAKDFTADDISKLEKARDNQRKIGQELQKQLQKAVAENNAVEQERLLKLISDHGLMAQTLNELVRYSPKEAAPAELTPAPPPKPQTPAGVPQPNEAQWLGKPVSYWERLSENLPKGDERARLAKQLGVVNQPAKILAHINKRIADVKAAAAKGPALPKISFAAYFPEGATTPEIGANHPEILKRLGIKGFEKAESRNTPAFGFTDETGKFLTREQAAERAKQTGQNLKDFEPDEPAHSDEIASPTEPEKPISETPPVPTFESIWNEYNEGETGTFTERDALRALEAIDPETIPTALAKAADAYQKAIEEDFEMAGRGYVEPAQERFMRQLKKAATKARKPKTPPPSVQPPVVQTPPGATVSEVYAPKPAETTKTPVPALFFKHGNRLTQVTPEHASEVYEEMRDEAGAGASQFPPMPLYDANGKLVGQVSYNGNVWLGEELIHNATGLVKTPEGKWDLPPPTPKDLEIRDVQHKLQAFRDSHQGFDDTALAIDFPEFGRLIKQRNALLKERFGTAQPVIEAETKPPVPETKAPKPETLAPVPETKPLRIVSVAVRNPKTGEITSGGGKIHAQLYPQLGLDPTKMSAKEIEQSSGYIDSEGRFVTQDQADAIARKVGQIPQQENLTGEFIIGQQKPIAPPSAVETPAEQSQPPKTTGKQQKKYLLSAIEDAIKAAPEGEPEQTQSPSYFEKKEGEVPAGSAAVLARNKEKFGTVRIEVPDDGIFDIINTKTALRDFAEKAKRFPLSATKEPPKKGTPTGKPTAPIAMGKGGTEDVTSALEAFVSDDPSRFVLQHVFANGKEVVATDGRHMVIIKGGFKAGTPKKPAILTTTGKAAEFEGDLKDVKAPDFEQVRKQAQVDSELWFKDLDTGRLFNLLRQAQEVTTPSNVSVSIWRNPDGSLAITAGDPEVGTYAHNQKEGATRLASLNPQYLLDAIHAARKMGSEKVDLYGRDDLSPVRVLSKGVESIIMPMRIEGPPQTKLTAPPPAEPPKPAALAEGAKPAVWKVGDVLEFVGKPAAGFTGSRWLIEKAAGDWWRATKIGEAGRSIALNPNNPDVLAEFKRVAEGQQAPPAEPPTPPPGAEGPGSPAYGQGPDPQVVELDLGSPAWNRLKRQYQNFFGGLSQLWARRPVKRDIQSLSNAANNLPRIAGLRAGDSVRVRTNEQGQNALTFVMQALKMSGEGLSEENAARLGELEFASDPIGYLRSGETDLQTMAQQFKNEGKLVEAQAALDASKHMRYAREHFNELKPIAQIAKAKFDRQIEREQANGIRVDYENWYVPQRHELDLFPASDRPVVLGHSRAGGPGGKFSKAKFYEDYKTAIENGFVPKTFNLADLLEHRVTTGERLITGKGFFDSMRGITDPVDSQPIVMDIPRRQITRADGSIEYQEAIPRGYTKMEVMAGTPVAVHDGYRRLVNALTTTSQIADSAIVGTLQDIAAVEKHIGLALDTFHASRTMQTELALTHKVSLGARQRLGRALVEYSVGDLDAAVNKGEISQEMADYIRTPQAMEVNGQQVAISPHALLNIGIRNGLNIARFGDALYKSWLREMPITGAVNKWVFDKLTRSAVAHGFLAEFERIAKAHPELTETQVASRVSRDINVLFGNLGAESFFRNPSLRSINQVLFLAPQWVESLARREARGVGQIGEALIKGRAPGSVGKTIGTGLAAYFVATQVLNLITRGHLTFQNPEKGHKLDAWIPGGQKGFFISPLSVFGEISHDILRYAQTKPDFATALQQIGFNKLGPLGRFLFVMGEGRDPLSQEKIVGTGRRAIAAAVQAIPRPIFGANVGRAVEEGFPALLPSLGIKTESAPTAQVQIYRLADSWKANSDNAKYRSQVERRQKEDFGPSDYRDLRSALSRGDLRGAQEAYQVLRQGGKAPKTIRQTLSHPHPFTGSQAAESKFKASLSPADRELYNQAVAERRELYIRFQQMLRNQQPKEANAEAVRGNP